jgi:hydroxymethylbilane synthase
MLLFNSFCWNLPKMSNIHKNQVTTIRIATRESQLALAQSEQVKALLEQRYPELNVTFLGLTTEGDRHLSVSLQKIGGKGLFVKELETSLLNRTADIAVHSAKDVPMLLPEGLTLTTFLPRVDPRDALVTNRFENFAALPAGAVIGTSSLRRICQLQAARPDLQFKLLRGNVITRLRKLDDGEFDAIILAAAGLTRLNLEQRITELLPIELSLPACGQGVIAIEACDDNVALAELLQPLDCAKTRACVLAERAMNRELGGSCSIPIGAYAQWNNDRLWLRGMVGSPDGALILRAELEADADQYEELGKEVAKLLLSQGAKRIIDDARHA